VAAFAAAAALTAAASPVGAGIDDQAEQPARVGALVGPGAAGEHLPAVAVGAVVRAAAQRRCSRLARALVEAGAAAPRLRTANDEHSPPPLGAPPSPPYPRLRFAQPPSATAANNAKVCFTATSCVTDSRRRAAGNSPKTAEWPPVALRNLRVGVGQKQFSVAI